MAHYLRNNLRNIVYSAVTAAAFGVGTPAYAAPTPVSPPGIGIAPVLEVPGNGDEVDADVRVRVTPDVAARGGDRDRRGATPPAAVVVPEISGTGPAAGSVTAPTPAPGVFYVADRGNCPEIFNIRHSDPYPNIDKKYAYRCVDNGLSAVSCRLANGTVSRKFVIPSGNPLEAICSEQYALASVIAPATTAPPVAAAPAPEPLAPEPIVAPPPYTLRPTDRGAVVGEPASATPAPVEGSVAAPVAPAGEEPASATPAPVEGSAVAPAAEEPAGFLPARVYLMREDLERVERTITQRKGGYDTFIRNLAGLGEENAEALAVVREGLAPDLLRVRGLRTRADERCNETAQLYQDAINSLVAESQPPAESNQLRAPAGVEGSDRDLLAAAVRCRNASREYDAAQEELLVRVKRNLTRRGGFVLEVASGYTRYGFDRGGELPRGANLGNVRGSACYDASTSGAFCLDGSWFFFGEARARSPINEPRPPVQNGEYVVRSHATGERVAETTPQFGGGLRYMTPDLAQGPLEVRVGVRAEGVMGEHSVRTDRTTTSQLQTADGIFVGSAHVVSGSDVVPRNYVDFVPGAVMQVGSSESRPPVFVRVGAGYSTRLRDAVVGVAAGFRIDP